MPIPVQMTRLGGAQIPVGTNIQANKREILKALDWAKENEVNHLLTPEGALSGYVGGWEEHIEEIQDALKEIEEHQQKSGVYLHLGTNFKEPERFGEIHRNEIRHYHPCGRLYGVTYKSLNLYEIETTLNRDVERDRFTVIRLNDPNEPGQGDIGNYISHAAGLICNDMWGSQEARVSPLTTQIKKLGGIDLIFHATNGRKMELEDPQMIVFDSWHDAFLRMSACNTLIPILTVDSCTDWEWDGDEDEVNHYHTSSESGFIDYNGWQTDVPRVGRQYFKYDYDITMSVEDKFRVATALDENKFAIKKITSDPV